MAEIDINNPPKKEEIEDFWGGIWHKRKEHNRSTDWLPHLKDNCCKDAESKGFKITPTIFKEVMGKMKNNSAPGTDLVVPLWIKKGSAIHQPIINVLEKVRTDGTDIPHWLATMRTIYITIHTNLRTIDL